MRVPRLASLLPRPSSPRARGNDSPFLLVSQSLMNARLRAGGGIAAVWQISRENRRKEEPIGISPKEFSLRLESRETRGRVHPSETFCCEIFEEGDGRTTASPFYSSTGAAIPDAGGQSAVKISETRHERGRGRASVRVDEMRGGVTRGGKGGDTPTKRK